MELRTNTPLPEGTYVVEITEIGEIKPQNKAVEMINAKDSRGNLLRDDNNNIIKDQVKNYAFETVDVKMKVIDGEHTGRVIYGGLTTHDNVLFLTENFLYAVGVTELTGLSDIYKLGLIGKTLKVETQNQTYTKDVVDQNTGITTPVEKTKIRIKKYIKNTNPKVNA